MQFTFLNVAITLTADTPAEAYTMLCNALATLPDGDWQTDVYTNAADVEGLHERSTQALFPPAV